MMSNKSLAIRVIVTGLVLPWAVALITWLIKEPGAILDWLFDPAEVIFMVAVMFAWSSPYWLLAVLLILVEGTQKRLFLYPAEWTFVILAAFVGTVLMSLWLFSLIALFPEVIFIAFLVPTNNLLGSVIGAICGLLLVFWSRRRS